MDGFRRDFLKFAASGAAGAGLIAGTAPGGHALAPFTPLPAGPMGYVFDVRRYGAAGDGKTLDTRAINAAIEAAAAAGGGTVFFPAGTYATYSIHLKSFVALYLDIGATLLAAPTPLEGTTSGGYDAAEPQDPAYERYQDYGHNHWHNSLIWGENIHDVAILGPGMIDGKGLSRGREDRDQGLLPDTTKPGVGNKAIALKNCHNVLLRDFAIFRGGWFGLLATGVDNLTIDNLKIDTNRDGLDIDCCRNVRVSNCSVNSPWDDGICPKSSFALGYARATENVTITNCFLTGNLELGTLLDGTFKPMPPSFGQEATGRIKCGTESNGGFKNITISNCVFASSRGFALETVDGALCEDITFTGVTMRDIRQSPFFLRLGRRMRGPAGVPVGTLKRVILSNITSYGAVAELPSILSGVPGYPVEDIQISDLYLDQLGGGDKELAARQPPENEDHYPEPNMFGKLPATGFFMRHARNVQVSNVEIAVEKADARPAFWLADVDGADFFRVRVPRGVPAFRLAGVKDFRTFGSMFVPDRQMATANEVEI